MKYEPLLYIIDALFIMKQDPGEFFKKYLQRNALVAEEIFALYLRFIQDVLSWYP